MSSCVKVWLVAVGAVPACRVPFASIFCELPVHVPFWLQRRLKIDTRADHVFGKTADAVGTGTNRILLHSRDTATIGSDTASVTGVLVVAPEACWRSKVESTKGSGYTESVSGNVRVKSRCRIMYNLRAGHDCEIVKATDKRAVSLESRAVGSRRASRTAGRATELSVSVGSWRREIDW